jgi:SRSO17 transposase
MISKLARQMLGRALDAGVLARWATADEAYGQDHKFRIFCEQRRLGYVVAVPPQPVGRPGDWVWQHRDAG